MGAVLNDSIVDVVDVVYIVQSWNVKQNKFVEVCKFDNLNAALVNAQRISDVNKVATKINQWKTVSSVVKLIRPA